MGKFLNGRDLILDYFDVFNAEVRQFLDPVSSDHYDLRGSHVHIDSKVKRLEEWSNNHHHHHHAGEEEENDTDHDHDVDVDSGEPAAQENSDFGESEDSESEIEEQFLGSFWSAAEKAVFFHCLSRFSIHRLESWRERLPCKSKFEILTYYEVLKNNLLFLKRSNMKGFGGVLSRTELPFAYEVTESFVSFEESMSRTIRMESESKPQGSEIATEHEELLISFENWNRRWKPIYSKSNLEEFTGQSTEPLPFSAKAMDFLLECCQDYARKLVWATVLVDFEKKCIYKDSLCMNDVNSIPDDTDVVVPHARKTKVFPHVITKDHVSRAISFFKLEGKYAPTLADTVLETTEKFKIKHDNDGKLFKNNKVTMSLLPSLLQNTVTSVTLFEDTKTTKRSFDDENSADLIVSKKLYKLNGGKPRKERKLFRGRHDSFITDDEFDRIENPLEMQLCDWEADQMEAHDLLASQLYQHTLLTYFAGNIGNTDKNIDGTYSSDLEPCYLLAKQQNGLNVELHPELHQLSASTVKRFLYSNT